MPLRLLVMLVAGVELFGPSGEVACVGFA